MSSQTLFVTAKEILCELLEPNDFNSSTWMAMGASLLLLGQYYLPSRLSSSLPLVYLLYRIVKMIVDTFGLHTFSYTSLVRGRWTATLGEPDASAEFNRGSDGIVMFVLGARINQSVITLTKIYFDLSLLM